MAMPVTPAAKPMVTFVEAVKVAFRKYADFTGRATRAEYWWWVLFSVLAGVAFGSIDGFIASLTGWKGASPFQTIFGLATLLPSLAVTSRRLHDIGKSGWWQLAWWSPLLAWITTGVLWAIAVGVVWAREGEIGWDVLIFLPAIVATIASLLVTLAVVIWLIVWMVRQGQTGPNRFGPDPRALDEPETPESPGIPGTV